MTVMDLVKLPLISLPNALDCEWAQQERETMLRCAERSPGDFVELQCSDVDFIDSAGIGLLVSLHRHCKSLNKILLLSGIKGQPLALVRQAGLDRVVEVRTVDDG